MKARIQTYESTEVVLVISETDNSSETAIGYLYPKAAYRSNIYGDVVADGVRLRSAPSLSATVLELMYCPERVLVDLSKGGSEWYYVQRIETTKTWGYVSIEYVYLNC